MRFRVPGVYQRESLAGRRVQGRGWANPKLYSSERAALCRRGLCAGKVSRGEMMLGMLLLVTHTWWRGERGMEGGDTPSVGCPLPHTLWGVP